MIAGFISIIFGKKRELFLLTLIDKEGKCELWTLKSEFFEKRNLPLQTLVKQFSKITFEIHSIILLILFFLI